MCLSLAHLFKNYCKNRTHNCNNCFLDWFVKILQIHVYLYDVVFYFYFAIMLTVLLFSDESLHTDVQVSADQQELIYNSFVRTHNVV